MENINKNKPEFSYILGVILGDGFFLKRPRDFRICLKTIDEDFALNFKDKFKCISNSECHFYKEKNKSCKQGFCYRVFFISKLAYLELEKEKKDYKNFIKNSDKEHKTAFINGLFDSEGCVTHKKYSNRIIFNNLDKELVYFIQELLIEFGIETKIYSTLKKCGIYYELNVQKKIYFSMFYKYFHFSIQRKQQRLENLSKIPLKKVA